MKRIIYLSGFVTVFLISSAVLFRLMDWTGVDILALISSFLVVFTAVIWFSDSLKHWKLHSPVYNTRIVTGFLSALLISDGTIFKVNHFAGGYEQIVVGVVLFNLVFLPIFFYHLYKKAVENISKPIRQL